MRLPITPFSYGASIDFDREVVEEVRRPQALEVLEHASLLVVRHPHAVRRPAHLGLDVIEVGLRLDDRDVPLGRKRDLDEPDERRRPGRRQTPPAALPRLRAVWLRRPQPPVPAGGAGDDWAGASGAGCWPAGAGAGCGRRRRRWRALDGRRRSTTASCAYTGATADRRVANPRSARRRVCMNWES